MIWNQRDSERGQGGDNELQTFGVRAALDICAFVCGDHVETASAVLRSASSGVPSSKPQRRTRRRRRPVILTWHRAHYVI